MTIRPATSQDLDACRRLDGTCQSDSVWNMQQLSERESVTVLFSSVRLPRPVEVPYPARADDLAERLERGEPLFVAEDEGDVLGWLAASLDRGSGLARLGHLVVTPERRRQGVATALLREAVKSAREAGMRALLVPCQAKNGPAIAFCRRLGLELCGYNEQQYGDHDVSLLFAYRIR
jgi:GNAT superfamily N-acetyltransferase